METEQLQQVLETIKTFDININGDTTMELAKVFYPIAKIYYVKEFVGMGLSFVISLAVCLTLYKVVKLIINKKDGSNN